MGSLAPLGQAPQRGGLKLTRRQKAAIIVHLLLSQGVDLPLRDLPDDLQEVLTQVLGSMRHIDRDTLDSVVAEFVAEVEELGLTFPAGLAGALNALDGRLSPHTSARLRKEAGVMQAGDPWDRVRGLEPGDVVPLIEQESAEVAAIVLSKLEVGKAAQVLGKLPGDRARRITYAISQTTAVSPEALDRIGLSMAAQIEAQRASVFDKGPAEMVGAILNHSTSATRDDMLMGLDETDSDFADQVRRAIFTFANIPARIAARDIPKVVRNIDQIALTTAIAAATDGAEKAAAEHFLSNMSGRLADQIREEAGEMGKVKAKDGEAAMNEIVTTIRTMEAAGDLLLLAEEDED
ncbi:flagellar motor switch protein FliG [Oceanicola sp. 22II-s10i]|uniref:flagellar motor switch protein FliG n=1 Tax=Oceanicola sp. 22II-s10i TaxID=1317116 RepID=UPI000B521790|nr:FliG C-terminal domain-containing protein [Oceanicola sp. 22II-s10i]OWU82909.1 flagellar motor switch protein FliG [Oceanicola sp. 22II-s10i]